MNVKKKTQNKESLFAYKHSGGKGGIYMMLHGKERLVHPYALYEALWNGREKLRLCHGVDARFLKCATEVEGVYFDDGYGCYRESYTSGEFIDAAIGALRALCVDVCSFATTHYGDKLTAAHAEQMMEGVLSGVLERRSVQIFADDIVVEDFAFCFVEEYSCDTRFVLRIGDRKYHSSMSDWSNSYDLIRHEMEAFAIGHHDDSCQLRIYHEDAPNTLLVEHHVIHGNDRYSDVAKVTFTPDTFVGGPILFGWCKRQQVLRALYLGFLRLFVRESKSFDESEHGTSWNEYRLMAYNKLQSCIVEDYLMGTDADDLIYHQRQRIVHTVAEMKADYTALVEKLSSIYFLLNLE